jgi:predicted Zn-dependent peptidase
MRNILKPEILKLANGLEVILIPMKETRLATIMILVKVGSGYEIKKQSGISHFTEHLLFKGTKKRKSHKEISNLVESIGGKIDGWTMDDITGYHINVIDKNLEKAIDVLSDIYQNSVFNNSEIEKEKKVIIEEINMYEDDPISKAGNLFLKLVYGNQPAGWGVLGRKESVLKLKRNDFVEYVKKNYTIDKTKIVVAGSFNRKKTIENLKKRFNRVYRRKGAEKIPVQEKKNGSNVLIEYRKIEQGHFVLGIPVFDIFDKRRHILAILSTILGKGMSSRLWILLREKMGVSYYISADEDLFSNYGYFSISSGVNIKKMDDVLRRIKKELKKISSVKVGEAELKRAKEYIKSDIIMKLEGADDFARFFGFQRIYFENNFSIEEIFKKIDKVSIKDIQELAKELFEKRKFYLSVVGPFKEKDKKNFEKILS